MSCTGLGFTAPDIFIYGRVRNPSTVSLSHLLGRSLTVIKKEKIVPRFCCCAVNKYVSCREEKAV